MTDIDLELLKTFYEVATQKSITKASKNLFVSQPAVTQSIKKLETELNGTLFNRSCKGITLTNEGEMFYSYVKPALEMIRVGEDQFENYKSLKNGELKIGISATLTKIVLIDAITKFHKDFPGIKITIKNGLTSDLLNELNLGKLDLVIHSGEVQNSNLTSKELIKLDYCFVANQNMLKIKNKYDLKDILTNTMILQNKQSTARKTFEKLLIDNKLSTSNYVEVISQDIVCSLAQCGIGIGFCLSKYADIFGGNLKHINLNIPMPNCKIFVSKSNYFLPTFASKKFEEYLV